MQLRLRYLQIAGNTPKLDVGVFNFAALLRFWNMAAGIQSQIIINICIKTLCEIVIVEKFEDIACKQEQYDGRLPASGQYSSSVHPLFF